MAGNSYLMLAEDLCALGQLSLSVAWPLMLVFKIPTALLPTSLLSTQTEKFGIPAKLGTLSWAFKTDTHWQATAIKFTGVLIGYFEQEKWQAVLLKQLQRPSMKLRVLDPVMADAGQLYPAITPQHVATLRDLAGYADVLTPNLTEACLLTQISYFKEPTDRQLIELLGKLKQLQPPKGRAVITGVIRQKQISCCWLEDKKLRTLDSPCLPGHFYGSGDAFAALLTGFLWQGYSWSRAVQISAKLLVMTLQQQQNDPDEQRRFGIKLDFLLSQLLEVLAQKTDKLPKLS
mgnify:CR=1 FL=1